MRSLLNPKWLLLLNSLPVAVLLLLLAGKFSVIRSLLTPESLQAWRTVGAGLLALGVLHTGYALWCLWRRQPLPVAYGVLALLLNLGGMYYYFATGAGLLFPPEVPRWMVGSEAELYAFTFLMPTVAHAVLLLVVRSVPADRPVAALPSFGLALGVPLCSFLLVTLLDALPGSFGRSLQDVLGVGLFMLAPLTFLFFLARGLYVVVSRKAGLWHEHQLLWKLLIAGVLPLLGLAVNANLARPGVFGDFRSPWFYALAALNALLLCLPAPAGRGARLALLLARSATLSYTLYFFVVFLPFLPLSVLAVIAIGTGFLMLAPLLLLLVHAQVLDEDLTRLRGAFPRWGLRAAVLAGLLVLPLALTVRYGHYRRTLHAALAYVYAPDYARPPQPLDADALLTTLAAVRSHKSGDAALMGHGQPYLSTYFNWLVLDNLTLSDEKLTRLERIFGDEAAPAEADNWAALRPAAAPPGGPRLTRVQQRSRYDAAQGAWISWVDLEITGPDSVQQWNRPQYAAELALPPGCWVQDYYLDIAGRREHGILAELKAAAWVYAQILNEGRNRDPGILHYLRDNRLGLRVFPFAAREVRRTGICFVHKEPVQLQLDGRTLALGDAARQPAVGEVATAGREVVYLSRAAKQRLPRVQRRPYYHFLLDVSAGQPGRRAGYRRAVQALLARQPLPGAPRFTLVDAYARALPAGADWQRALADAPAAGGLYLAGALRQTLARAQQQPRTSYPVLVVVTDRAAQAVLDDDVADLAAAYPESPAYYVLPSSGSLEARSLRHDSKQPWPAAPAPGAPAPVRAWPTAARPRAYLPDDGQPSIVLNQPAASGLPPNETRWLTGLRLQGYQQQLALQPAAAAATRLPAIQASFRSGILTPLTAYLSLENDAQKAALRRKQQEVLQAHAALDAGEDTPPTAVPLDHEAALLLAAGAALAWWHLRRRAAV
ncbi:MSEP-CTERM sorting domain-containing protein [Hymenobacter sp. 15J16-1T3B]|uniref:MSEP-CTERM sorting domain-containing protein n=1 Tax=Hymenobacter sp. 15J16-1T3B TaxID=2886941 RepID=UPI001D1105AE|nr:MSEP-CTERM sorting domain-containing protein [Hymenobacter sp. 15J16-1T3B]MCC3160779.1 MSEP-CTERM sorting domain-containing protein [Hymenobacter sp. 15J16-1T3B]